MNESNEALIRHLELVQTCISRMATNTFVLKGWSVTLAGALLALASRDPKPFYTLAALVPTLSLWGLDAYYLRQERLFRKLYDHIRNEAAQQTDPREWMSMSTTRFEPDVPTWRGTLFAKTVLPLYGIVIVATVLLLLWLTKSHLG